MEGKPPSPLKAVAMAMAAVCQPKYFVLALLVLQNTFLVLLMRYTRTRPGTMYLGSTAVCCDEALKLITCLGILTFSYVAKKRRERDGVMRYTPLSSVEVSKTGHASVEVDISEPDDSEETFSSYLAEQLQFDIRVAGVAGLFTIQKNLIFLSVTNLDAAVFQVTYQAKILTTAVFSVYFLNRKLSNYQIMALFVLTMGVALVQLDKVDSAGESYQEQSQWVGLLAVMGACCTSGLGGVYFELVLKPQPKPGEGGAQYPPRPPPSVWAKNVQLSGFAFVIAFITAFVKDHTAILYDGGFFQGYTPMVLLVIVLQAGGGLVVAAVIKYADNILKVRSQNSSKIDMFHLPLAYLHTRSHLFHLYHWKTFATAISIVTSTILSAWIFDFSISEMFVGGCLLQFVAVGLYSRTEKSVSTTQQKPDAHVS
ncbi:hypothetical protein ACHAWF_013469 [Thalassiosira exigua]